MKIAIVGTGISGLVAAHHLHREHEIVVYEAAARLGGHTHTVPVEDPRGARWIDTGFIVFNDRNYPNFEALLAELGVASQPSHMSFSVSDGRGGFEYSRHALGPLRPPLPPAQPALPPHAARLAPLQPRGAGADRDERDRALARPLARAATASRASSSSG